MKFEVGFKFEFGVEVGFKFEFGVKVGFKFEFGVESANSRKDPGCVERRDEIDPFLAIFTI